MAHYRLTKSDGSLLGEFDSPNPSMTKQQALEELKKTQSSKSLTQRAGEGVSRAASKVGQKTVQKFPFMKGTDTWPEVGGQMAGQFLGGALTGGSPFGSVVGGGTGGAIANVSQNPALSLLSMKFPKARKEMVGEAKRSFKRGSTFSALGESVPYAWKGAKAAGREILGGMKAASGVGDRAEQLLNFPLKDRLRALWPGKTSIPTPGVAGQAQAGIEKSLGIKTAKQASEERIFGEASAAKPKTWKELPLGPKKGGTTAEDIKRLQDIIKKAQGGDVLPEKEKPFAVAKRVYKTLKEDGKPLLKDAVQGLREIAGKLSKVAKDTTDHVVYSEQYGKFIKYIESQVDEYAKARKLTHLSNIREDLLHLLPVTPKGEVYRFAVLRLLWRIGLAVGTGGFMSPYTTGVASVAGDLAGRYGDKLLTNQITPAMISGTLAAKQGK